MKSEYWDQQSLLDAARDVWAKLIIRESELFSRNRELQRLSRADCNVLVEVTIDNESMVAIWGRNSVALWTCEVKSQ